MGNWFRVLLVAVLALSRSLHAEEAYTGPNEDPTYTFSLVVNTQCAPSTTNINATSWASLVAQVGALSQSPNCVTAFVGTSGGSPITSDPGPPYSSGAYWLCGRHSDGSLAGCPTSASVSVNCGGATNRSLQTVSGFQRCVSTCYSRKGQVVYASVATDEASAFIMQACLQVSGSGLCEIDSTFSAGPGQPEARGTVKYVMGGNWFIEGDWVYTGQRCTEDASDAPVNAASGTGPVQLSGTGGSTGVGTTGGGGLSSTDSTNLASTASESALTNTRLNQVLAGQCGGLGQPACAIDEGATGSTSTDTLASMDASKVTAGTSMDTVTTALASPPSFVAPGGHWLPSFTSILPAASCSFPMTVELPGYSPFSWTFSVCSWGGYARDILGMVCYVLAGIFVWFTLFRVRA